MCGIVGYIGSQEARDILLNGLEKLEYRGYDSAGIALLNEEGIHIFKEKGRIDALRDAVDYDVKANLGIGHTRWATHGAPSRINAHPHQSFSGRLTIIHNGMIENFNYIKRKYLQGIHQISETDTEVIVQLIEKFTEGGLSVEAAFKETLLILEGSYALVLLDNLNEHQIYVGKNKSPLLIGVGQDFHVIASDTMASFQLTNEYIEIMDKEMVLVRENEIIIKKLTGEIMKREPIIMKLDACDTEKGPYPHYMLKEINEQPGIIRRIINEYQNNVGKLSVNREIREAVKSADRIYIIACRTSYHAGLVGKQLIEKITNITVEIHVASEFLYNTPILSQNPLFIFISQSGETADSKGVLVKVKKLGYPTLTITDVPGSTLSREADYTLLTYAGPEIAIASTKVYTAQIAVLTVLACNVANANFNPIHELSLAANAMEILIKKKETVEDIVWDMLSKSGNCFFIGRSVDYYVCLEGALKLKGISYIQAEGFDGGELKHGTIALIEKGTTVVALLTQSHIKGNIRSYVQQVKARGANVCMISMEGLEEQEDRIVLPYIHKLLTPLISVIPMQYIAYYAALYRGCDIDKPRHLAKSVTAE